MSKQVEQTVLKTKQVPTLFGNIKKAMARLENNIASGKTEKAKPKTPEQMLKQYVKKAIEQIGKCKNGYEGMLKDKQTLETLAVLKQIK
jgi:protein involved in temperature-dependent protein secretion